MWEGAMEVRFLKTVRTKGAKLGKNQGFFWNMS